MTTLELTGPAARQAAHRYVDAAPDGYFVRITDATRTLEQNALLWPLLTTIAKEVDWYGQKLTKEDWKDVFSASLKKQRAVPGSTVASWSAGNRLARWGRRNSAI